MKKGLCTKLTASFTLALAAAAYAQPANDTCATAQVISSSGAYAFDQTGGGTEVVPSCGFGGANDVWYSYTAGALAANIIVDTCGGAGFDTILAAYDACGGLQIACNDDTCNLQSSITFSVPAGQTRKWSLSGYNGSIGSGTMIVTINTDSLANDTCAGALVMTDGSNNWSNRFATQDTTISCAFGGPANSGVDVWYTYTAPATGTRNFEVTSFATGDSTLAIFDACGGTELACDDDAGVGLLSKIPSFAVTAGTTYKIRLSGWGNPGGQGAGVLSITEPLPPSGNDACVDAVAVLDGSSTPFAISGGEVSDITPTCGFDGQFDIWYKFTNSGADTVVLVADTFGSTFDTILTGWNACGGTQIACNDDSGSLQSKITVPVNAGETVYLAISGYAGAVGSGVLNIATVLPPANDGCAGALAATLGANNYDSTAASSDGNFATCAFGGTPDNADVWFSYTAGSESFITLDTFGGGIFDTTLAIYDACGGTEVACNDDAGGGLQSQICNFPVTSGTTYYIRAASWGAAGAGGAGVLNIATSLGGTPFSVPSGAISEPEVCGTFPDVDNGGCNSTPEVYTAAALCDTFVGTGYFDGSFRDTDWYQFTLDSDDTVTMSGQTQFAGLFGILQVACPNASFVAYALLDPSCDNNFSVSATLTAGTYVAFAAPQFTTVFACGTNDQYWFTLTGTGDCNSVVCNDIDVNNDGSFFDPDDIDAFLSVFSEGPCVPATATCDSIDFNNDTSLFDPCDIDSFLLVFSEGPCTYCGL